MSAQNQSQSRDFEERLQTQTGDAHPLQSLNEHIEGLSNGDKCQISSTLFPEKYRKLVYGKKRESSLIDR
ncbi:MAG: hypothetical protein LBH74_08450 [Nitrososphaerota archaeon]|jgi:hypothetical protein|nr:hypothetical protein [Nitrososphaerota archaeon]